MDFINKKNLAARRNTDDINILKIWIYIKFSF